MKGTYTFFIASSPGKLRKVTIPVYVLHGVAVLAIIGSITVAVAIGSYSRMLWKVTNYNALRHEQDTLKKQYQQLQNTVTNTNQRLDSLQSLATEVAMTYGVLRYHPGAFSLTDTPSTPEDAFDRSIQQFTFLVGNRSGYGRIVIVDHGFGIATWYAHLSAFATVAGARVKRGQVVGYTGISGRSTGPHVHYEVRMNNAPVNPWRYLRSTPAAD